MEEGCGEFAKSNVLFSLFVSLLFVSFSCLETLVGNIGWKQNNLFSFQPILFWFDKWLVFLLISNCFSVAF